MTPGGREQSAPAGGSAVEPTTGPDAGAFFTRSLDPESRENSTVTETARSSQHRVVDLLEKFSLTAAQGRLWLGDSQGSEDRKQAASHPML